MWPLDRGHRTGHLNQKKIEKILHVEEEIKDGQFSMLPIKWSEFAQSCPTLCDPWTVAHQALLSMGFSRQEYWSGLPFSFSRGSFWPRDQTCVSWIAGWFFTCWAIGEVICGIRSEWSCRNPTGVWVLLDDVGTTPQPVHTHWDWRQNPLTTNIHNTYLYSQFQICSISMYICLKNESK